MAADAESEHDTDAWDRYSYIVSSHYRTVTLDRLADGPATPTQIADDAEERITHISRALRELRDENLVDLLVSDERKKGRVYGLTEAGRDVAEMVEEHHTEAA